MGYLLGIDLGASFSGAATIDDGDASPTMVGLGHRAPQVPSVIYARDAAAWPSVSRPSTWR